MMLSMSTARSRVLPEVVRTKDGAEYPINANFRTILKILRLFADDDVMERQKLVLTCKWFYPETQPDDLNLALTYFQTFLKGVPRPSQTTHEVVREVKQFDYEFDGNEIWASFMAVYHIDLLEVEFLHWYKFQVLLVQLPAECAFNSKIELRFRDLKGLKGDRLTKTQRAKQAVQLPVKLSQKEQDVLAKLLN